MAKKSKSLVDDQTGPIHDSYLFEVAWEVCNQVGGIYTVIQSKVPSVLNRWDYDNYIMLGPYFEKQVGVLFEPINDVTDPIGHAVNIMRSEGYEVHYGRWLITGRPKVVLFNPFSVYHKLDFIKYELWEKHHISSPTFDDMINQVVCFGYQAKEFFRIFANPKINGGKNIIAHFHEWMAGTPIPGIKQLNLPVKIVFTTHATLLGRYLAMNDDNFYNNLPTYDWRKEAQHFNIEAMVNIERAAAHGSHIFTTISEPTAEECIYLVGRRPEKILPNGLNIKRFEAVHEFQNLHQRYKEQIHEFIMGHFFPSYSFDLNKTLYFFTSGRFEYHNKGFDLTLEALARLNWRLRHEGIDVNVVTFFITRQPNSGIITDVLNTRFLTEELRRTCDEMLEQLSKRMFAAIMNDNLNQLPDMNKLIDEYLRLKLRRTKQTWKTDRLPLVVTHNMIYDDKDPILNFVRTAGLVNKPEDKVKIIYHPDFLSVTNPLFRMDYGQFVRGCHLGVFPSYYEPWGYTPLECIASGIPSVTTDLTGFGEFVQKNIPNPEESGIYVIKRKNRSYHQSAEELANLLFDYTTLSLRERINIRNNAEATSVMFDWDELGKNYQQAYHMALRAL